MKAHAAHTGPADSCCPETLTDLMIRQDAYAVMHHLAAEEAQYLPCSAAHHELLEELCRVIALDGLLAYDCICRTANYEQALLLSSFPAASQASYIIKMLLGKEAEVREIMQRTSLDDLLAIAREITEGPAIDASMRQETVGLISAYMDGKHCWFSHAEARKARNLLANETFLDAGELQALQISLAAVHLSWRAARAADCIRRSREYQTLMSLRAFKPFIPMVQEFYRSGCVENSSAASGYASAVCEMLKDFVKI